MDKVIIHFSNKDTLVLKEGDRIIPIVKSINDENKIFASMDCSIPLEIHIHNGLIPSLLDALYRCSFFYINSDQETAFGTNTIVKIEMK